MTSTFQFDAFISYNRNDAEFAGQLEKALEHYSVPRGVRPDKHRIKVFRDTDDMTGSDYDQAIRRHLDASRKLILICSPNARGSEFVDNEVKHFIDSHSAEAVIPVLLRGIANNEPGDASQHAFPQSLVNAMGMPLGVDYRQWRKGSPRSRRFHNAWYSMLADLFDTTRDDIEQRDRRHRAVRNRTYGGIAAAVLISSAVLANNWWSEKRERETAEIERETAKRERDAAEVEREAAEQISKAQQHLQRAVTTEDDQQRAIALAAMVDMPEVDGVLEAALATGVAASSPWSKFLISADARWDERIGGTPNDRIRPLAATTLQADCEFSLPGSEFVEGLRSPDGSVDIYTHDDALFVQNSDGLGPAMVTCLQTLSWDTSAGTEQWRQGTETPAGRMGFASKDGLPVALVKDLATKSLNMVRLFRPGKHVLALGNVESADFSGTNTLTFTATGLPPQTVQLPETGATVAPPTTDSCFSYRGDALTIGEIFELNGIPGYQEHAQSQYEELRACTLDNGRVWAYATATTGEFVDIGIVAGLNAETMEKLFKIWAFSENCTAFGRNTISYCTVGDLTGSNITEEAGFRRFGQAGNTHPLEDEVWSPRLYGESAASPDRAIIALWGSAWHEDPADRPVVVWLEDQSRPRPIILESSPSPVAAVSFSPDSRYLLVRRDNGQLRLYSFATERLLKELRSRVAPLRQGSDT